MAFALRHPFGAQARNDGDHDRVEDHRQQARHHPGREELGDVDLGHDPVEHQDHRGRDHDAQRAPRRDEAGGDPGLVAGAAHLGQCHLRHRGGRGHRRTVDGREAAASRHRGQRQAAAAVVQPGAAGREQLGTHARMGREGAHQDEHRDDDEVVVRQHRQRHVGQQVQARREPPQRGEARHARDAHGHADGHTQCHQREHADKAQQGDEITIHGCPPR